MRNAKFEMAHGIPHSVFRIPHSLCAMVAEQGETPVSVSDDEFLWVQFPINLENRAIRTDATFVCFRVKIIAFVEENRRFAEDDVAVSEPTRHEQLPLVLVTEAATEPLSVGRRIFPDVHRHIEDFALQHPDELCLGEFAGLKMQAPKHSPAGIRLIILHKTGFDARFPKGVFVVTFEKVAPVIFKNLWLKNDKTRNVCLDKSHAMD